MAKFTHSEAECAIIFRALQADLKVVKKTRDSLQAMHYNTRDADADLYALEGRDGNPGLLAQYAPQGFVFGVLAGDNVEGQMTIEEAMATPPAAARDADDAFLFVQDGDGAERFEWREWVPQPRPQIGDLLRYDGGQAETVVGVLNYDRTCACFEVATEGGVCYVTHGATVGARDEWRLWTAAALRRDAEQVGNTEQHAGAVVTIDGAGFDDVVVAHVTAEVPAPAAKPAKKKKGITIPKRGSQVDARTEKVRKLRKGGAK